MKSRIILLGLMLGPVLFSNAQRADFETKGHMSFGFSGIQHTVKTIDLPTGVQLEYAEQGGRHGIPVIFLHGYTDSWHSFESILHYLPTSINAFVLSQRGHGNSSKPQGNYHPKDFAADVAAFIAAKRLDNVIIVGHSMGGVVTQQFALDYPQMLRGIVLVSTDASFIDNPGMPEFAEEIAKLTDPIDYSFAESFQKSTIMKPVDSAYVNLFVSESMKLPARVWKAVSENFMNADYSKELHRIRRPALILWGDKDVICSKTDQDQLVSNIKDARFILYKGTGHALHWEDPVKFSEDITAFIYSIK